MGSQARHLTKHARLLCRSARVVKANKKFQLLFAGTAFDLGRTRASGLRILRDAAEILHRHDVEELVDLCVTLTQAKLRERPFFAILYGPSETAAERLQREFEGIRRAAAAATRRSELAAKKELAFKAAIVYLAGRQTA